MIVRIMYIMLNKIFRNLPYIRLWLLYVAATPFILYYSKFLAWYLLLKRNLLSRGTLNNLNWHNPISNLNQNNSPGSFLQNVITLLYLP